MFLVTVEKYMDKILSKFTLSIVYNLYSSKNTEVLSILTKEGNKTVIYFKCEF